MIEEYDVAIIGAGPAGLISAARIARENIRVVLIETKEDVTKLGFYTIGTSLDLTKWNITEDCVNQQINKIQISIGNVTIQKQCRFKIIGRSKLHYELFQKCLANNVAVNLGQTVVEVKKENEAVKSLLVRDKMGNEKEVKAKLFVDCSGVSGVLTKEMELIPKIRKQAMGVHYEVILKKEPTVAHLFLGKNYGQGFGWIFPTGEKTAVLGYGTGNKNDFPHMRQYLEMMVAAKNIKEYIEKQTDRIYSGTVPDEKVSSCFIKWNVVALGNSVAQEHPIVREGYRFIAKSANFAAEAIVKSLKEGERKSLEEYQEKWNETFHRKYQILQGVKKIGAKLVQNDQSGQILLSLVNFLPEKVFEKIFLEVF